MMQKKCNEIFERVYSKLKQSHVAAWCFPKTVCEDIHVLGKEEKFYYTKKITYVVGLMLFSMVLITFYLVQWMTGRNAVVREIVRPEAFEETREVAVRVGKLDNIYQLEIAPVMLSKEQAEALFLEVIGVLDSYILGRNESLECVTENLYLPENLSEYPFEIYWESDKEHIVDTLGVVNREGLEEDEVVMLTAVFRYEDWIWEEQFGILVCKEVLSEEEEYKRQLEYLLTESENHQRGEGIWVLPESFQGEVLSVYAVEKDYTVLILAGLVLVAAVAVWLGQDYDLHMGRQKRRAEFQNEYISFVESLSMYISSGLTMQAAMQNCMGDYVKRKPRGHLLRTALEEFQRDLENGCSFLEAMDFFAHKADNAEYRHLTGMLGQGILNGSQGLSKALEQEVEKAREEKRRQSKIKGEQVSTALIGPMMLQLGIIIALIMIPAFTNMQF